MKPVKPSPKTSPTIYIGAEAESVREITKAILAILSLSECGDPAKCEAMVTLREATKVNHVVVRDCVFNNKKVK